MIFNGAGNAVEYDRNHGNRQVNAVGAFLQHILLYRSGVLDDLGNADGAADLFASLGDYLDSAEKAEECRTTGEQFKAEIEAIEARHREEQRLELERQEAEKRAAEEKRRAEIKAHNDMINTKIAEAEQALREQNAIYAANAGKIFGSGAQLKKTAKAEIVRLESVIANLKRTLR